MAANSNDLAQNLIRGGLAPQAATLIANAIANVSSPQLSQGRNSSDVTPKELLRLIDADTRRYQLTNLDYSPSQPFQDRIASDATKFDGAANDHPYKDSQPLVDAPPLSNPRVQAGDYITVDNEVDGEAAVSKVGLRLRLQPGVHLRLDPSTKSLQGIPLTARTEGKFLSAEFVESEDSTDLVISIRGLTTKDVRLADGSSQSLLTWENGTVTPAPTNPEVAVCRALVIFNGTRNATNTGPSVNGGNTLLFKALNINLVQRMGQGWYKVWFTSALPDSLYTINILNAQATLTITGYSLFFPTGGGPTVNSFEFSIHGTGNTLLDPFYCMVSVFA